MDNESLLQAARKAQEMAYAPYSGFAVGACVLTKQGRIFTGCNIENATYGATNCAERTAVFKAVSEGCRELERIAVVGPLTDRFTFPCGICLQVLLEFMPDGIVVLERAGQIQEFRVSQLLPFGFQMER